ncbi:molybdenum cofactor biosynthesis protein F [Paraburkholderia caffeinilytica]|uniref:Molybdenum cofactor biosynthesis protein F n=1 Tax=Paraburkholderia caffeinilytica TaxID=1761016 RepID=A0ABQ1ME18_9BURK|nr:MoaF C-terminal domain-containing protein [Paraburkholderia caffeinilytica]AXL49960.1 molybdenum cofactor biosynthesis protein F [Paraburkholderia caffeinilytica]GGC39220.1 molybdenum cofactor biosynthesis protein F [Paraburkholderia caffeinilytica]CAB3786498.1 Protein MoaF [Paraburkholderia caffeinilytica]
MASQPVFIQVGELADGFAPDSHILPALDDLVGKTLRLAFADHPTLELEFATAGVLRSHVLAGQRRGSSGEHRYRATSLRSGIYLVDFVGEAGVVDSHAPQSAASTEGGDSAGDIAATPSSSSFVLDLNRGLCTSVVGTLPSEAQTRVAPFTRVEQGDELTSVRVQFRHGTIAPGQTSASAPRGQAAAPADPLAAEALHRPTGELIGMRNLYTYSATERYEHVYLNENFYAWQCLSGVEQGLADVDRCHYFAIDTNLYLFVWREKIIPTLGVVMIDLDRLRTDGKIFGYKGNRFDAVSNFPVGAHARILNTTRYPQ